MYVPLTKYVTEIFIPFDIGLKWVLEGLKPLGEEYVKIAEEGIEKFGWAKVETNKTEGF
jgi:oligoendopeptidase F